MRYAYDKIVYELSDLPGVVQDIVWKLDDLRAVVEHYTEEMPYRQTKIQMYIDAKEVTHEVMQLIYTFAEDTNSRFADVGQKLSNQIEPVAGHCLSLLEHIAKGVYVPFHQLEKLFESMDDLRGLLKSYMGELQKLADAA